MASLILSYYSPNLRIYNEVEKGITFSVPVLIWKTWLLRIIHGHPPTVSSTYENAGEPHLKLITPATNTNTIYQLHNLQRPTSFTGQSIQFQEDQCNLKVFLEEQVPEAPSWRSCTGRSLTNNLMAESIRILPAVPALSKGMYQVTI